MLWVTVVSSHERFEFYGHLATELNRIGKTEAALAAFGKAEGYARSGDPRLAGFQNHFGRALHLADRRPEAMEHYRLALAMYPETNGE